MRKCKENRPDPICTALVDGAIAAISAERFLNEMKAKEVGSALNA
jgi:hypothetical protein